MTWDGSGWTVMYRDQSIASTEQNAEVNEEEETEQNAEPNEGEEKRTKKGN